MSSRLPSLHFWTYRELGSFRYPGNGHFSAGLRLYEDERERLHFRESFLVRYLFSTSGCGCFVPVPLPLASQLARQQGIYPLQLLATLVHRLPRFFLPLPRLGSRLSVLLLPFFFVIADPLGRHFHPLASRRRVRSPGGDEIARGRVVRFRLSLPLLPASFISFSCSTCGELPLQVGAHVRQKILEARLACAHFPSVSVLEQPVEAVYHVRVVHFLQLLEGVLTKRSERVNFIQEQRGSIASSPPPA